MDAVEQTHQPGMSSCLWTCSKRQNSQDLQPQLLTRVREITEIIREAGRGRVGCVWGGGGLVLECT